MDDHAPPIALNSPEAAREKWRVATTSLAAAVALVVLKLAVGLWTNSLGILSEAAHSGLDFLAGVTTLWAIRLSAMPADRRHPYGHGKFENIAALFQTVILMVVCVWIGYEALGRLAMGGAIEIRPSIWAFGVVLVAIVVDLSRSLALRRVARKYNSRALEADALHFATDVWSSLVVLVGLFGVSVAEYLKLPWLVGADAAAALVVAVFVLTVSIRLAARSVGDLLDTAPRELPEQVRDAAAEVDGVESVEHVRVRQAGPESFADVTLSVRRQAGLELAHDLAHRAEEAIRRRVPGIDVVVHVEPIATGGEDLSATIHVLAKRYAFEAHGVRIYRHEGGRSVELHLEVDQSLDVATAHRRVTEFEEEVRGAASDIQRVVTHIEPAGDETATEPAELVGQLDVYRLLGELLDRTPLPVRPHDVRVHQRGAQLDISFHCGIDPATSVADAHRYTEQIEAFLHARLPEIGRVVIHVEPEG